jgi:glutamine amidotransferase
MITIIDYGMGNLGSIANMVKKVGAKSIITSDLDEIQKATKLILPGVGSFDNGMKQLRELGFIDVLNKKILEDKTPIMGICLGMQLMTQSSEEGTLEGLGWIEAKTHKFVSDSLKVPHMGWNISMIQKDSSLYTAPKIEKRFYFVHSYYVSCKKQEDILSTTSYGHEFVSSFEKENIIGVQFHPEKSHKFGMALFKNFVEKY